MKKTLFILFMIAPILSFSQVASPSNVFFTLTQISGNADANTVVKVDKGGGTAVISIPVNKNGYFEYTFETPLTTIPVEGGGVSQPSIAIWNEDFNGTNATAHVTITAVPDAEAIQGIRRGTITLPVKNVPVSPPAAVNPEIDEFQPISSTYHYKVTILNTNFVVPIARFNFTKDDGTDSRKGEVSLFSSVGAGVGISWGELEKTTDANGETLNTDFTNTIGIHLGILFSSGKDGTEQKNIFAPTLSVSVLDFQLGFGVELGTTTAPQNKGFLTLAYAIPLSKLVKGKYYIFRASKGFNSRNVLTTPTNGSSITKTSKNRFV
ncbi:hypothetical protein [Flavobacterium sp.]|uniref:hypothetical protein n=1 Tax=Flavobacterium sp. TaxID=239 RepID=UPI0025E5265D|nr:hypothetical protein [Flavobacterium sp.]